VVSVLRDEGVSGANGLESRIALAEALGLIRERTAEGLVVFRLDRLARDLVLQEQLLAEIWKMNSEVFSTSAAESDFLANDPEDPSRRLIRQMLGAVAEYERAMIFLRLRLGRKRKAESGGFAYGSPPYGFTSEKGSLVRQEQEQEGLRFMKELRLEGYSLPAICSSLETAGFRPKRGTRWHPTTVARALRRAS
jgi:DNA invertase Pin-like site-specific DNA recombinase